MQVNQRHQPWERNRGISVFWLRSTLLAPLLGLLALLQVLPYVILAFGVWLYLSRLSLSPEHSEQLGELLRWVPGKRTRSLENNPDVAPIEIIAIMAAIALGYLALFRTHRSALRMVGHGDTGSYWMLILPSFGWVRLMTPAMAVGVIIVLGPRFLPRYDWMFSGVPADGSIEAHVAAHLPALALMAAGIIVVLAPVGCRATQIAASQPLPFRTLFLGLGTLLVLGVIHGVIAVPLTYVVVEAMVIVNDALSETPFLPGLNIYQGVQGAIHWMAMSVACVMVLERHIDRVADAVEAPA